MTNVSKNKGTAFETAVVNWLHDHGFPKARRLPLVGAKDVGDVGGLDGVVLELKNCKAAALGEWMKEAEVEAHNADAPVYAVVHKRRGKGTDEAYVTVPLHVFAKLLESFLS
jgi:hypothetical protein